MCRKHDAAIGLEFGANALDGAWEIRHLAWHRERLPDPPVDSVSGNPLPDSDSESQAPRGGGTRPPAPARRLGLGHRLAEG